MNDWLGPNWKPTFFGLVAGVSEILSQEGIGIHAVGKTNVVKLVGSIAVFFLGYFAKDRAVTGGTVASTSEAVARVEKDNVSPI